MKTFWLCFFPLFVAVDPIGILPIFMGLTQNLAKSEVRRTILQSVVTATAVALAFLFLGMALLTYLGIQVADFMVAGGVLIFAIALSDMLRTNPSNTALLDMETVGAVPLGVPLIAGPAVLTTSLLLINAYGALPTAISLIVNILLAGAVFSLAPYIHNFLGKAGSRTISKISNLLLAAIAVMMIRKGITELVAAIVKQ
jgi:multiple antibiotic resistance protein